MALFPKGKIKGLILAQIGMILLYFLKELGEMKIKILNLTKNYLEYISQKDKINQSYPPKKPRGIANKNQSNQKIIISNAIDDFEVKNYNLNIKKNIFDEKDRNEPIIVHGSCKELHRLSKLYNLKREETKNYIKPNNYNTEFFEEYLSTSPDDMEYDDAIIFDKRKFWEHFLECLKDKQIIAQTFIADEDLKPRSMKIIVLILNFILYYVVNGLFFSESVISELYELN